MKKHLEIVAAMPCCACGKQPCQAHHLVGRNMRVKSKSPDVFAISLCYDCHAQLHHFGWRTWEQRHGSQIEHSARTLETLLYGN